MITAIIRNIKNHLTFNYDISDYSLSCNHTNFHYNNGDLDNVHYNNHYDYNHDYYNHYDYSVMIDIYHYNNYYQLNHL